ncbi:MAG: hypothetical protein GX760_04535 [Erysipelothrix sp.]|nr:hypothetical protein [Erysipelothrix sp.]
MKNRFLVILTSLVLVLTSFYAVIADTQDEFIEINDYKVSVTSTNKSGGNQKVRVEDNMLLNDVI